MIKQSLPYCVNRLDVGSPIDDRSCTSGVGCVPLLDEAHSAQCREVVADGGPGQVQLRHQFLGGDLAVVHNGSENAEPCGSGRHSSACRVEARGSVGGDVRHAPTLWGSLASIW